MSVSWRSRSSTASRRGREGRCRGRRCRAAGRTACAARLAGLGLGDLGAGDLGEPADDSADRLVVVDDQNPGALDAAHTPFLPQDGPQFRLLCRCCSRSARLPLKVSPDRTGPIPPITTTSAPASPQRRRSGREGPRELTAAFRRYVERVQGVEDPTPQDDLEAALILAQEIMGHRRGDAVDASLAETYAASIRQLARPSARRPRRGRASGAARPRDRPRPDGPSAPAPAAAPAVAPPRELAGSAR